MKKLLSLLALAVCVSTMAAPQVSSLTKEKVLAMSIEDLSDMSLEDLMYAVELLDVQSVDELFAMIMNKNVSSASKKAEDSFKSPLSTTVITRAEMREFGCSSIEEALRLIPGVIAREKTNGNYDVHLRGLDNIPDGNMLLYTENVNTLLMLNGRPVYNYAQGATMWETLPVGIEDVARIEVVRGPSSALYGSNAVTGVINIITENPNADSKTVQGSIQNGSLGTFVGDIAFRKAFNDKWAASISGNYQARNRSTRDLYIIPSSKIVDTRTNDTLSNGAWVSVGDMEYLQTLDGGAMSEHSAPLNSMFPNPEVARQNIGINGALSYAPAADININLTGGYQQSLAMTTPVGSDYFSLNQRQSKTGYVDLTADVKGINLQVNITDGVQDFMKGTPSFKINNYLFTATAEYDWTVNDKLTLRPGINYRHNRASDEDYNGIMDIDKFGQPTRIMSFFEGEANLRTFAGSLRADYKPTEHLRLIGAYRAEKLNLPDDIYHSWQLAATYSVNDNNNLRFIYSRANRSSIFVNTSCNYNWTRVGISSPDEIGFSGNEDAAVMYADNLELGYRWRPAPNVQFDFEAFYNMSYDYGALMSESATMVQTEQGLKNLMGGIQSVLAQASTGHISMTDAQLQLSKLPQKELVTKAHIKYQNLPYEVKQSGISMAMDWIISDKLVAKLHANVQNTTIDNYYRYDQSADIQLQFAESSQIYKDCIGEIVQMFMTPSDQHLIPHLLGKHHYYLYEDQYNQAIAEGRGEQYLQDLRSNEETVGVYFALRYRVRNEEETGKYTIGASSVKQPKDLENGYKHKNTPSFYGMVGLIYKPIDKLTIAGHGYFYGKQTMITGFGSVDIDPKFVMDLKMGYKPTEQFEIFFNAHNLFNDSKREFAYMDHTRGIYSFGINFGL